MPPPRPLLGPHAASPAELRQQVEADRLGEPYLLFRDEHANQAIAPLPTDRTTLTVGRAQTCDLCLAWDLEVSALHAQLERLGGNWTVEDDGLSRNGSLVNGERLAGRHRLRNADVMRFGSTEIAYRAPEEKLASTVLGGGLERPSLSDAQHRVLVALCRPYMDGGAYTTPPTNREIADTLVLSVEAVKTHLRALFLRFGIEELPQNAKRVQLVKMAFDSGAVMPRDFER